MKATFTKRPVVLVTSRVLAAILPGFILTNTFSIVVSFIWPAEKQVAVAWATLLAFLFYTIIIMWVFHTKSLVKVWSVLMASITITGAITWWFVQSGAGQ